MNTEKSFRIDSSLFPFQSRFLTLDSGSRIHYIDEGSGPTVLFLHGNPTWSFLYRDIINGLRDNFRCIALDYPGFGLSKAEPGYQFLPEEHSQVVEEFVDSLDLAGLTIMMQDWGGPIGFQLALRRPKRVSRFIIGNTFAWPLSMRFKFFSGIMGGPIGRFIAWSFNGVVRFFMWNGVRTGISKAAMRMYLAPFSLQSSRNPTHIFPRQLIKSSEFLAGIESGLQKLAERPALILWGEKDFAFQERERKRFESLFTNHSTVLLPRAGHFIQEDAASECSAAIRDWFGSS